MKVVVIGGIHHNTLGVIRSLGETEISKSEIKVILIDGNKKKKNIISLSKYVFKNNIVYVENNSDILDCLNNWKLENEKQVIICCSDGSSEVVIKHSSEISQWYYAPSIKADISEYMSKEAQSNLASSLGLNVPESINYKKNDELEWETFPCITKPMYSALGTKSDIHISYSKDDLELFLNSITTEQVQIQKLIDKKMEYQLIGCSLNDGNTVIIPGYTKIIRQPEYTNTGYLEYLPIKLLQYDENAVSDYLQKLGYNGLFSLEFIRDQNDQDYFLEINMRNDGNAYCVKSAGVNLPYIWCYYQMFGTLPETKLEFDTPVFFIPDWLDARRGIQSIGVWGWAKQFHDAKSHAVYNRHDMGPFLFQSKEMAVFAGKCFINKVGKVFRRGEKK